MLSHFMFGFICFWGVVLGLLALEDTYFVREGLFPIECLTWASTPEITHRKPVWDEPVSGGVPRRALGDNSRNSLGCKGMNRL